MEKLKSSFPTSCKQSYPQFHKTASYTHYQQCRLLRNPSHSYINITYNNADVIRISFVLLAPQVLVVLRQLRCFQMTGSNWQPNPKLLDDGDYCVCPQLISYSLLCKWFRIAVLPADKELYAELYHTEDMRRCSVCGAPFASSSNRAIYCPDCRKRITRRQTAERMRKMRGNVTR